MEYGPSKNPFMPKQKADNVLHIYFDLIVHLATMSVPETTVVTPDEMFFTQYHTFFLGLILMNLYMFIELFA